MGREMVPWLQFDFGDPIGIKKFTDRTDAAEFMQGEFDFYQWTVNYQNDSAFNSVSTFIFNGTHQGVYGLNNPHQFGDGVDFLRSQLNSLYTVDMLPLSFSALGQFISDVRQDQGDKTALGCLAFITKRMGGVFTSSEGARGVMLAFAREYGHSRVAARSIQNRLDKLSALMSTRVRKFEEEREVQLSEFNKRVKIQREKAEIQKKWDMRRLRKSLQNYDSKFNEVVSGLNDVKATYQEFMKLKAPVDYWTEKAKQHRLSSERYRKSLIGYGKLLAPLLIVLLGAIAFLSYYIADPAKPIVAQLVFAAIGVLITTVAFWAARIVIRLFMSEHHLAIDAEERATMAMTYLALIERGAADEKDRALILAPLFRATSDGIVKDDAAPEFSPAAIASRLLTSR